MRLEISCKLLSPKTIRMKCQALFSGEMRVLKALMIRVKRNGVFWDIQKCASISSYACAQYHQGIHSELLHSIISRQSISGHRML